jgi:alpha-L-rhamnosidase
MLTISHLRCEYLVDPLGIDEPSPRLSWILESARRGARQNAYRVLVASSPIQLQKGVGDLWDSGRIESDRTTQIVYAGMPLRARNQCHWTVEVWDDAGNRARSEPALWSMGLNRGDWTAKWIAADPEIFRRDKDAITPTLTTPGTPPLLRKEFEIPAGAQVRRATLYVSARGLLKMFLGAKKISDDLFVPEWTDYDKRVHYRTFDVAAHLAPGKNVLAAALGDGWWSGYVGWQNTRARYGSLQNSMLMQLEIELDNGASLTISTDPSWRAETGPILASDFMMGESYDARRERTGWLKSGYDDSSWLPVKEVPVPTAPPLVAQPGPPVRITEQLTPVSVNEIKPGTFIYDLGQNIAGWVRLKIPASFTPAGTRIRLRHGERLNPDGTLYTENLRRAAATDSYITKDENEKTFEPHFTFHGFQFIEITGLKTALPVENVTGCVIHSATPPAGKFECSHPGVNRLWLNGLWSQRDNFLCIPTDCPQRDERLGWMGDAQVFSRTATYNMDVSAFFTKWMIDVEDAQTPDGIFPDIAPRLREGENFIGLGNLGGAAGWADAGIIIPFTMWRVYGDGRIIQRHWNAMVRWLDFIERNNPSGLRLKALGNNYGDWLCIPSDTSFGTHSPMKYYLATAYWANDALMMERMARALGKTAEAARYRKMFEHVRDAIQKEWLLPDGQLNVETQTAYLLALAFNLIPDNVRARAAERLVDNIKNLDWHLSTGFIGISHLNPQLTLSGHADVAYKLLLQEDYPSWLYPVRHGATTIWERWNGWTHEDGFFDPQMNSLNHYSLGSVGEWLFRHVAGIELDPEVPAFKRFILRPFIPPKSTGLTFARATYQSLHGEILSHWKRTGPDLENLEWTVKIPPNTAARVFIPSDPNSVVSESGIPITPKIREDGTVVEEIASGTYIYRSIHHGSSFYDSV